MDVRGTWPTSACRREAESYDDAALPAAHGQLHVEPVASMKLFAELTTLTASLAIVAICAAEGLDGSALTSAVSIATDDFIALV